MKWDARLSCHGLPGLVFGIGIPLLAAEFSPAAAVEPEPPGPRIQHVEDRGVVRVVGLPGWLQESWGSWSPGDRRWRDLLAVTVRMESLQLGMVLPPLLGEYAPQPDGVVEFKPEFPWEPGMSYVAVLRYGDPTDPSASDRLVSYEFSIPKPDQTPVTVVREVYPRAERLPENLLKFYLEFSRSMSRGRSYRHIALYDQDGQAVELPFLELDEELWNPDMSRLTLFIDPGRIKRGVKPLEDIGPALEAGRRFRLVIAEDWQDAKGLPLAKPYSKTFTVGPPDRLPPDPETWTLRIPTAQSRDPLVLAFGEPMDHALAKRLIDVQTASGKPVGGDVTMQDDDREWVFRPRTAWQRGSYEVRVSKIVEDLAGNNIGKPFEVETGTDKPVPRDWAKGWVRLPVEIP